LLALGGIGLLIPPGGTIAYSWLINALAALVCLAIAGYEWTARQTPPASPQAQVRS
jgi:hypothetical protein